MYEKIAKPSDASGNCGPARWSNAAWSSEEAAAGSRRPGTLWRKCRNSSIRWNPAKAAGTHARTAASVARRGQAETAVPLGTAARRSTEACCELPEGFTLHKKLERARNRRAQALDDPDAKTIDWAMAEELAFASILEDGTAIRMTGEDVERGTFSQRHAVFHDVKTGKTFTPLQALPKPGRHLKFTTAR